MSNATPTQAALAAAYQTRASAVSAAARLLAAPGGTYRSVEFLPTTLTTVAEGGPVYEPVAEPECWRLVEVSPSDVQRRQQSAMRHEVRDLYKRADDHDVLAAEALERGRLTSCRSWERIARELRTMAREIETRLVVNVKAVA